MKNRNVSIGDNDILLWLKALLKKINIKKNELKTPAGEMIKKMQRFLLSYNENVIMFTVANQKAIVFHFHPSMFDSEGTTFKAYTEGAFFICNRIQSEL